MTNKDYINSKVPVLTKRIVETKEIIDYDPPIIIKTMKTNKIKNISSRKVYKEYIGGMFHKSIFF